MSLPVFRKYIPSVGRSLAAAGLLALAACAHPTPYQAEQDGQGYSEKPIEDDRYRVTFAGNSLTKRETVEDYLLFRAAEVTLQRGYDYFLVVEKDTERKTTKLTSFSEFGTPSYAFGYYRYSPFYSGYFGRYGTGIASETVRERHKYNAYANIQLRRGAKPDDDPQAYDARDVLKRLAPTITYPEPA